MRTERYHPLVAVDLRHAIQHYDAITRKLGDSFRINVRAKILAIVERPESFGFIGGEFRGPLIERFPFVVVFTIENGSPLIYGIRHATSDPQSWFDRSVH